ncbi:MAG: peptidoglycan editing factor PgeF [Candidatus Omnitrophota bacterium]
MQNIFKDGLTLAFSNRRDGNMSFNCGNTKKSLNNRRLFLSRIGIKYQDLICAKQIHSTNVFSVTKKDKGSGALAYESAISDTDALVTNKKNLPLGIHTADCLSIFIYDSDKKAVGIVHAGWHSTKEKIIVKTIHKMQNEFNSSLKDLFFLFGPAIRSCCYKVGESFSSIFSQSVIKRGNDYYFDLIKENHSQILSLGVTEKDIFDSGICTSCQNKDYFSYRKEGNSCGRILSVIILR